MRWQEQAAWDAPPGAGQGPDIQVGRGNEQFRGGSLDHTHKILTEGAMHRRPDEKVAIGPRLLEHEAIVMASYQEERGVTRLEAPDEIVASPRTGPGDEQSMTHVLPQVPQQESARSMASPARLVNSHQGPRPMNLLPLLG
jgi:hypothetical protein